MLASKRIGFIGAGAMAEALIKGFLNGGLLQPGQCMLSDVSQERLAILTERYGVGAVSDNATLARQSDILFLAVKPQVIKSVLADISQVIDSGTLVVSIAAGIRLSLLEEKLPGVRILRVMPNTPAAVGAGMAAISAGKLATAADSEIAVRLLETAGRAVLVPETLMDAVTGLSGSGPGYAFVMIDALADAGVRVGFDRRTAILMAAQTLLGAAKMVLDTGEHPAKLRDLVTSPAGTTIAGIQVLEQRQVRAALIDAVVAASSRSTELNN
ncbi:MAG: pyrroline-5-carboxylate reductase [Sporomusaceae bacterium]|nr:pyrroline-5-carboxylate reductase [Sporomusaceae bacterium]